MPNPCSSPWLFTTRPGDPPVPDAERHRLSEQALAKLQGAASERPTAGAALVFTSRLSEQVLAEGQLPVDFEGFLRALFVELGLTGPLRATFAPARGVAGDAVVIDGIGASLASLDVLEQQLGVTRAAVHVRHVTQMIGEWVHGIARSDLDAISAALHENVRSGDVAGNANETRAGTRMIQRFVETRAKMPLPLDAAAQIATLLPAIARRIESVSVLLEACHEEFSIEGMAFRRHPATGDPTIVVAARCLDGAQSTRVETFADLAHRSPDAAHEIASRLDAREGESAALAAVRFACDAKRLRECAPFSTEVSPLARLRTAVALERECRITRSQALTSLADLQELALRVRSIVDDGVIVPLARGAVAAAGVRSGRLALSTEQAARYRRAGHDVVSLFDARSKPALLDLALGRAVILLGGDIDSEIARSTRRIGVPALVLSGASIDEGRAELILGEESLREGDPVTVDAWTGALYAGELPVVDLLHFPESDIVAGWRSDPLRQHALESGANR